MTEEDDRRNGSRPPARWANSTPVSAASPAPDGPGQRRHPVGVDGRQLGELAAVDDGSDLRAEVGEAEQQPEADADDDDEQHLDDLVDAHVEVVGELDGRGC